MSASRRSSRVGSSPCLPCGPRSTAPALASQRRSLHRQEISESIAARFVPRAGRGPQRRQARVRRPGKKTIWSVRSLRMPAPSAWSPACAIGRWGHVTSDVLHVCHPGDAASGLAKRALPWHSERGRAAGSPQSARVGSAFAAGARGAQARLRIRNNRDPCCGPAARDDHARW